MLSSPFTSKFGTNYCAEENEVQEIEKLLVDPIRRLQALDDEITTLQGAIERLTEQRAAFCAFIDSHKALVSPIRRMPREIIQEIFMACIPTDRNCVMSADEAPVLLGRICSAWRTISLSTPRLWSRLHIVEPYIRSNQQAASPRVLSLFKAKIEQRVAVAEAWLRRSGGCGLSITVKCTPKIQRDAPESPIIQALVPFAARWEHIGLRASDEMIANLPSFAVEDVPMLKSLSIDDTQHTQQTHRWDSLSLCRAPRLTCFSASGSSFSALELPLQWAQLRKLTLVKYWTTDLPALSSDIALQILYSCPVLETFKFWANDPPNVVGPSLSWEPLRHETLQTLGVECMGSLTPLMQRLCGCIRLPELRNLSIHGTAHPEDSIISDLSYAPFLATSTRLENVQVMLDMFTKASLVEFIRCLPQTTQSLSISPSSMQWEANRHFVDEEILALLTSPPDPNNPVVCCPAMRELILYYCSSFSDEQLRDFIRARAAASRSLRRVVVEVRREAQVDIMPELKDLVESGLSLELRYHLRPPLQLSPWFGLPQSD